MELEVQYLEERHATGKKMLDFMGASCPSFAMVGTLIGLVSMLSKMENPDEIGRGMAVALVCTFWGALAANLIFIPLGGKLGQHSKTEKLSMEMTMAGTRDSQRRQPDGRSRKNADIYLGETPRGSKAQA
jgi:chemotaxis protein MotA